MKVLFLPMYGNQLNHYSDNPKETIDWLLRYDSHLVMEPGELADYARGAVLLLNSEAKITVIEPDISVKVPYGESAFLFFEPNLSEGFNSLTVKGSSGFKKVRIVSPKVKAYEYLLYN